MPGTILSTASYEIAWFTGNCNVPLMNSIVVVRARGFGAQGNAHLWEVRAGFLEEVSFELQRRVRIEIGELGTQIGRRVDCL